MGVGPREASREHVRPRLPLTARSQRKTESRGKTSPVILRTVWLIDLGEWRPWCKEQSL